MVVKLQQFPIKLNINYVKPEIAGLQCADAISRQYEIEKQEGGGCPITEVRKIKPEDIKVDITGKMPLDQFVEKVHARKGITINLPIPEPYYQPSLKDQIFTDPNQPISHPVMHHNFSITPDLSTANIIAEQMLNPDLKTIVQQLTGQPAHLLDHRTTSQEFTMKSGILLKILDPDKPLDSNDTRIIIPESLQLALTATYHVAMGHMHTRNLYKILSAHYYGKTVDKLTTSCAFCSMYKISQLRKCPLSNFQLATFPTEIYGMDHFFHPKRLGFTCVLLIMDLFSQFTFAFACRDESAKSICAHIESVIAVTGAPKIIKSDNSLSLLRSQAVSKLLQRYGVEHQSLSMSYSPRHNATVERSVRSTRQLLKCETFANHDSWPKLLRKVCLVRNTIPRVFPGGKFASPYEPFFNRKPPTPLITPNHLLDNFAFLNKSPTDVDDLRKLILQDLTKLKKNYLEAHNCKARPRIQAGDFCVIKEHRTENNRTGLGKQAATYKPNLFMCKALNGTVCVLEHLASNTIHMVHADFCKKIIPRDRYFDLLPKPLQDKIGASFLIDLESHDRESLQGAGFDTEFPITLPIAPEILPEQRSAPDLAEKGAEPPPPRPHPSTQRGTASSISSLPPIIPITSDTRSTSGEASIAGPAPKPPMSDKSGRSSWFGRIKGSLRQLGRKNYKQ